MSLEKVMGKEGIRYIDKRGHKTRWQKTAETFRLLVEETPSGKNLLIVVLIYKMYLKIYWFQPK